MQARLCDLYLVDELGSAWKSSVEEMVDPEPRRPMASLHQNTMVKASENALPPYLVSLPCKATSCCPVRAPGHLLCPFLPCKEGKQMLSLQCYTGRVGGRLVPARPSQAIPAPAWSILWTYKCLRHHVLCCCLQARGAKPGKGRLALLKEDNAKFCAPKTRIPTPAPKKKSRALTVPAPPPTFVSKIPSPKASSETGGPSSTCTPEANQGDAAQASEECSDDEAAAVSEVTRH